MANFLEIFKEHEEELEEMCPDFVWRIQQLVQKDIVATNRVGSQYSKQFSEDITLRCGKVNKGEDGDKGGAKGGDEGGDGGKVAGGQRGEKLINPPAKLSLQDRIKLQLNEKLMEDREEAKVVADMEEKMWESMDVEVNLSQEAVDRAASHFVDICKDCGERHVHEERECHFCGEVHEGCCDL